MKKVESEIKKTSDPIRLYNNKIAEYERVKRILRELKNYEFGGKECDADFKRAFKPHLKEFRRMAYDSSTNIDIVEGMTEEVAIRLLEEYAEEKKIVLKKELKGLERKIDRKMGLLNLSLKGRKINNKDAINNKGTENKKNTTS